MGDSSAEGDLDCEGLAQDVSEEDISRWPRDHSFNILVKNMAAFYPFPKSLPEAKLKNYGLTALQRTFQNNLALTVSHGC